MIITLINNMIEIVQVVCSDHAFGHENIIVIIKLYKKENTHKHDSAKHGANK